MVYTTSFYTVVYRNFLIVVFPLHVVVFYVHALFSREREREWGTEIQAASLSWDQQKGIQAERQVAVWTK